MNMIVWLLCLSVLAQPALALTVGSMVDLQSQHLALNPVDTVKSIEEACKKLGIDQFDVYGDYTSDASSSYLRKFEKEVASEFGKEDAVFMPSGVMAQNIALLIHTENSGFAKSKGGSSFFCHHSSHLLLWEEESYSELIGMDAVEIDTKSKALFDGFCVPPMRFEDVEQCFSDRKAKIENGSTLTLGQMGHSTLIIELPHRELGGKLTPWDEVLSIGKICKDEGVKYHCDGARIFEASAGYGMSLSEVAKPFDSVYISFYKGLGAISGAMLMGNKEFCDDARVWLRRFGGNLYTLMPYAASCWAGYRHHALGQGSTMSFVDKFDKLKRVAARIESETAFSDIASFDPPVPETNMVHVYLKENLDCCESARDMVLEDSGLKIFSRLREIPSTSSEYSAGYRTKYEWTMGEANGSIDDEEFIRAWKLFCASFDQT